MATKFTPPVPTLSYRLGSTTPVDPTGLVGDGPPLYNVHEATASRYRDGEVQVWVTGAMRKRDGTQGRHNRGLRLDLGAEQPEWVDRIVQDARTRLGRVKG